jgi:hypothetical protein
LTVNFVTGRELDQELEQLMDASALESFPVLDYVHVARNRVARKQWLSLDLLVDDHISIACPSRVLSLYLLHQFVITCLNITRIAKVAGMNAMYRPAS